MSAPIDGQWRRLAGGMLLIQPIRELLRFVPLLLVLLVVGRSTSRPPWEFAVAGLVILYGIGRFVSTRWRVTADAVEVRHGVLGRRVLTAPRERIRSIDISAHPLQRLLGLVRVRIGTGTSGPAARGVELDGVSRATAETLRAVLLHHRGADRADDGSADTSPPADRGRVLAAFRPRWLLYGPATLSGVVTAAAVLALGLRLLNEAQVRPTEVGPIAAVLRHLSVLDWWAIGLQVLLAVLIVTTLLSLAGYCLSYWGFRLVRHEDSSDVGSALQTSRGLLATRSTTIAEHRLHGVERIEPLLLRAVRGARLTAVATGLQDGRNASRGADVLLPPVPRDTVLDVERQVLAEPAIDPVAVTLTPRGPAARRRRYVRALAGAVALTAAAGLLWWRHLVSGWVPMATSALVLPALLLARDRFAALGHAVLPARHPRSDGRVLVSRVGSLVRRRVTLRRSGVIGAVWRSSPFQRRAGLVTLTITTAAGTQRYHLPDLDDRVALEVAADLVPAVAAFRSTETGSTR